MTRATRRSPSGWLVLLGCLVLFVGGAVAVGWALRGTPPDPTPVPDEEFSISRQEALALQGQDADRHPALPTDQDLGPYVNTRPVEVPDAATAARDQQAVVDHLYIPSIFVSAPIVPQGVTSSNQMALPDDLGQVGLLDTTSGLNATAGSTLVAGHVTAGGTPGALYFLGRVQPGASVTTVDAAGEQTAWVVTSVRSYRKTSLPPDIFATTGERMLALVTCGGPIIQTPDGRWTHEDNIVVTAVPVD